MTEWLDTSTDIFRIGVSAIIFIGIVKLLVARFGEIIPNPIRDFIAIV